MKVLSRRDLAEKKGIHFCAVHLRRLEKAGQFPKPFKLALGGCNFWDEAEIDSWLEERAHQVFVGPVTGAAVEAV